MFFLKVKKKSPTGLNSVSVRMEAIGGQGANSAGKILAEAAVLGMGFTGNHFSSFGSEKRGSPVRSFVRYSPKREPIRSAAPIRHPNILVIFHELLMLTHGETFDGVEPETIIIVNSAKKPGELLFPQNLNFGKIIAIDASGISQHYDCGLNAPMLGALSLACGDITDEAIKGALEHFFSKLPKAVQKNNIYGFEAGLTKAREEQFEISQANLPHPHSPLPEMGWRNSPIGGVIVNPGNSAIRDLSASRKGIVPKFIKEICFNCGYCDMVCPDFCFVWKKSGDGVTSPELMGIDYQYCKACQKCITVCPVEALKPILESEITAEEKQHKVFPEIKTEEIEEKWKTIDWLKYTEELSSADRMLTPETELLNPESYLRPHFPKGLKK